MNKEFAWESLSNPYKLEWINKNHLSPTFSTSPSSGKHFIDQKNDRLKALDLGAGAGFYSLYLHQLHYDVTAIDQFPRFQDANITFMQKSLEEKLPFADESFHLILAWDIIEHIKNEELLIAEIYRILKPGGRIILSVPHANDQLIASTYLTFAHFKDKTHYREYLPEDLSNKFTQQKFHPMQIDLVGGQGYPYIILNFIDNPLMKFLTRGWIWFLKKTKFLTIKDCHGDIFAVFQK